MPGSAASLTQPPPSVTGVPVASLTQPPTYEHKFEELAGNEDPKMQEQPDDPEMQDDEEGICKISQNEDPHVHEQNKQKIEGPKMHDKLVENVQEDEPQMQNDEEGI